MKKVHLNDAYCDELNLKGMTETPTYRYWVFFEDEGRIVKRIRRESLGTTAALSDASDLNPNGWQLVEVRMNK